MGFWNKIKFEFQNNLYCIFFDPKYSLVHI